MQERTSYPLRIPPQLKKKLSSRAQYMGISLNALMVQIFWQYVEGEHGKGKGTANLAGTA